VIARPVSTRHDRVVRWLVVSVVVHAVVLAWLIREDEQVAREVSDVAREVSNAAPHEARDVAQEAMVVEVIGSAGDAGDAGEDGPASAARASARRPARVRSADPWDGLLVRNERGNSNGSSGSNGSGSSNGSGNGNGSSNGNGNGIGFGNGGGVGAAGEVPRPPVPVEEVVSKARPATLVWPTRDEDVEDDADLFVARITVDTDGAVVGARMVKTRPGARGDDAANGIWRFRYLPALDERGVPIRSTFEQPFQVR
jgi:hypothetical protein